MYLKIGEKDCEIYDDEVFHATLHHEDEKVSVSGYAIIPKGASKPAHAYWYGFHPGVVAYDDHETLVMAGEWLPVKWN